MFSRQFCFPSVFKEGFRTRTSLIRIKGMVKRRKIIREKVKRISRTRNRYRKRKRKRKRMEV
jgi:hypothetical protein